MKKVDAYLFRRYFTGTLAALIMLLLCALVFEFIERSRLLLSEKADGLQVLWFLLLRLPQLAGLVLPISLVVGVSLANAGLCRRLEIIALATAGLGWRRLLWPAGACALLYTLLGWANAELLSPRAAAEEEKLQQQVFGWMDASWRFYARKSWFRGGAGRLYQIADNRSQEQTRRQIHFYQLDRDFRLLRRVCLNDAVWRGDGWEGSSALEWEFDGAGLKSFTEKQRPFYSWPEGPQQLSAFQGTPRAFGVSRLLEISRQMESRGFNPLAYRLEAHQRLSYLVCGLLLVLLAFPAQVSARRRFPPARALLEALGLVAAAYLLLAGAAAVVSRGLLQPWPGIWLAPALLALAAGAVWTWKWKS